MLLFVIFFSFFLSLSLSFTQALEIKELSSFSWEQEGMTEISVLDEKKKKIFSTNPKKNVIDIFSFNKNEIIWIDQILLKEYGSKPNSIAINNDSILAVAMEAQKPQENGEIILFDNMNKYMEKYRVGPMPDMIVFNKSGNELVVANEGEPSKDLSIDPLGSISIINLKKKIVDTYSLELFNESKLIRKIMKVPLSRDLEPEYITITDDERYILVSLQENNAIAVFDYKLKKFISIFPLGHKSYKSLNHKIDANDKDFTPNMRNWPLSGLYQPDAIIFIPFRKTISDLFNRNYYFASANEGDSKNYFGNNEEVRVSEIDLDHKEFENYPKIHEKLSRLKISKIKADKNNDGKLDVLYTFGGRSFSIWKFSPGLKFFGLTILKSKISLYYDSGDEFEKILADKFIENFNTSYDSDNKSLVIDGRSDDKGPEPESLSILKLGNKVYLIVALERSNGFFFYDITDLENIKYKKFFPITKKHFSPEGINIYYINNSIFFLVSYEKSGSLVMYEIFNDRI